MQSFGKNHYTGLSTIVSYNCIIHRNTLKSCTTKGILSTIFIVVSWYLQFNSNLPINSEKPHHF